MRQEQGKTVAVLVRLDHTTGIGFLGLVTLVSWLVNLLGLLRDLLVTASISDSWKLGDDKEKLWKARRLAKERWQVFVVVYEFWLQGGDKALLVAQVGDVDACNEKNNETLIAQMPILSVEDLCCNDDKCFKGMRRVFRVEYNRTNRIDKRCQVLISSDIKV
ncbi:hypothetical protein Tco_0825886 [Tanacetum coccineum]